MGGAGFVFTGENDADIMHNSVTINLNVLEGVRKLNETFDGVNREWTECNRPGLEQPPRFSILVLLACTQSTINLTPITLIAVKNQHTPPTPTPNTGGKNSSASGCISLIIGIMAFLLGLLATTISSDQKEPGTVEERKHQPAICRKVALLPVEGGSIDVWGDGYKLVPSCSLMNASKRLDG